MSQVRHTGIRPPAPEQPLKVDFGAYYAKHKKAQDQQEPLVVFITAYGVLYFENSGTVSTSSREWFDDRYYAYAEYKASLTLYPAS